MQSHDVVDASTTTAIFLDHPHGALTAGLLTVQTTMQRPSKPTHAAVSRFVESILPVKENDVPRLYHVPRNSRYDPETAIVEQIVLSVTPTQGVYGLIGYSQNDASADPNARQWIPRTRPPRMLCFLHRPFTLDRRSVRRGTLILSSHNSFDEILTVGWNTALAERLGLDVGGSDCVQGYKGDPERKIGIIGQVSLRRDVLMARVQQEFQSVELLGAGVSDEIRVVAIMNAFHEDEVHRVLAMAQQLGWIGLGDVSPGQHVLYLTGQPRVGGLQAAQTAGMNVACVGHRQAEDWGIRYLAYQLRTTFPSVQVKEIYEEEIPIVRERHETTAGQPMR